MQVHTMKLEMRLIMIGEKETENKDCSELETTQSKVNRTRHDNLIRFFLLRVVTSFWRRITPATKSQASTQNERQGQKKSEHSPARLWLAQKQADDSGPHLKGILELSRLVIGESFL